MLKVILRKDSDLEKEFLEWIKNQPEPRTYYELSEIETNIKN